MKIKYTGRTFNSGEIDNSLYLKLPEGIPQSIVHKEVQIHNIQMW